MVRFKGLILIIAAIISQKSLSCSNSKVGMNNNDDIENSIGQDIYSFGDTLFLSSQDYKILLSNNDVLDIEITNQQTVSIVKNNKFSVIEIALEKEKVVAKSNDLFSSSVPKDCDYFFPSDKGYIVFINNKINFRKVN